MLRSFWNDLPKPFSVLAPMEDVTDTVFRQIILGCGRPDVFFTEFTSSEGICSPGQDKVIHRLRFTQQEQPLVAQIWGVTPENYYESAKMIAQMGFVGIDLNMGCPVKKVIKQGACSALIKNPSLAAEIIQATKEGAGNLPVSIKTRLGFNTIQTEEWIGFLLKQNIHALTIHGRTVKELSEAPVHWGEVAKAVKLRDEINSDTVVIGNGDILSLQQGHEIAQEIGLDGIMIGRGVFQNPWVFNPNIDPQNIDVATKIELLKKHLKLFHETWQNQKNYSLMKKYFKIYINGFKGAAEMRADLMQTQSEQEALELLNKLF